MYAYDKCNVITCAFRFNKGTRHILLLIKMSSSYFSQYFALDNVIIYPVIFL